MVDRLLRIHTDKGIRHARALKTSPDDALAIAEFPTGTGWLCLTHVPTGLRVGQKMYRDPKRMARFYKAILALNLDWRRGSFGEGFVTPTDKAWQRRNRARVQAVIDAGEPGRWIAGSAS